MLWQQTLARIPSTFGRLVFLANFRDSNTGAYRHFALENEFGRTTCDEVLRQSHVDTFHNWTNYSLEAQKADLELYLASVNGDRPTIIETWLQLKPYLNLIPVSSGEPERLLYVSNLEALINLFRTDAE